jgi:hypothetical protein
VSGKLGRDAGNCLDTHLRKRVPSRGEYPPVSVNCLDPRIWPLEEKPQRRWCKFARSVASHPKRGDKFKKNQIEGYHQATTLGTEFLNSLYIT